MYFYTIPLNDSTMYPVYEYCEKKNIPITWHVNGGLYEQEFRSVLDDFPNYTFKYDSTITASDLRVLLAQAFFYLGNYTKAVEQLDIIEPGVNHPADNYDVLLSQIQNISFNF